VTLVVVKYEGCSVREVHFSVTKEWVVFQGVTVVAVEINVIMLESQSFGGRK
jgi:hypothetical protein